MHMHAPRGARFYCGTRDVHYRTFCLALLTLPLSVLILLALCPHHSSRRPEAATVGRVVPARTPQGQRTQLYHSENMLHDSLARALDTLSSSQQQSLALQAQLAQQQARDGRRLRRELRRMRDGEGVRRDAGGLVMAGDQGITLHTHQPPSATAEAELRAPATHHHRHGAHDGQSCVNCASTSKPGACRCRHREQRTSPSDNGKQIWRSAHKELDGLLNVGAASEEEGPVRMQTASIRPTRFIPSRCPRMQTRTPG